MNVFFDTSSLFKLYHREEGTLELMDFFNTNSIEGIYLAEIAKVEFSSTVWKKCRTRDISDSTAKQLIGKFNQDAKKYSFVPDTSSLKSFARDLIEKYWAEGLRTLDSLQLASVLMVKGEIAYFFTSDGVLKELSQAEGLMVK
jgi:predicted nucleic acid-binding protein